MDLGCGLGYFPRKLSSPVGSRGHVTVEDIRWLSLAFLWVRTVLRNEHNVTIIHGRQTDPHLPPNRVNALLISHTYHEFADQHAMLAHVSQAIVSEEASSGTICEAKAPNRARVGCRNGLFKA